MSVLKAGMALGFGLIISMGPQNIFLIRQGLKKEYAYISALLCSLCDMVLILLSTKSIGKLILHYPVVKSVMIIIGVSFLLVYGLKSIYSGLMQFKNASSVELNSSTTSSSLLKIIVASISFSLLNPQAIVDTMIMIGGVVNQYPQEEQVMFIVGVIAASFLWFSGLAMLSTSCAFYFNNRNTWGILEVISGVIMLGFSLVLIVGF